MAHNLYIDETGKAAMMYVREVPWHRLGTSLDKPATAAEAIVAAGLNYGVEKIALRVDDSGKTKTDLFATVRTDIPPGIEDRILGIVGNRYTVVQNTEAFSFFDAITGPGKAIYHTAGALGRGERIWILAKLPGLIRVANEDDVEKYLLLVNTHDGSSGIQVKFTPIRVVCENTLSVALETGKTISIPHRSRVLDRLQEAHELLDISNTLYLRVEAIFNSFATAQLNNDSVKLYFDTVYPEPIAPGKEATPRAKEIHELALKLHSLTHNAFLRAFEGEFSPIPATTRGTLWAAYNAVTEFADHIFNDKMTSSDATMNLWFGSREKLKMRAFKTAQNFVGRN